MCKYENEENEENEKMCKYANVVMRKIKELT